MSEALSQPLNYDIPSEIKVLRAIERQPLTINDLVNIVGAPAEENPRKEDVRPIVEKLFSKGLIAKANSNVFTYFWPFLGRSEQSGATVGMETPLTLTAKGNLHLHPLVSGQTAIR